MLTEKQKFDKYLTFSSKEYVAKYLSPKHYILQKVNTKNYDRDIVNLQLLWDPNKPTYNQDIATILFHVKLYLTSYIYKIPNAPFPYNIYLVWSVLYRKENIDSFYNYLRNDPRYIKAVLTGILSRGYIPYYTLTGAGNNLKETLKSMFLEIYQLEVIFYVEYHFQLVIYLYDVFKEKRCMYTMDFNFHPNASVMAKYKDAAIEKENTTIRRRKEKKEAREWLIANFTPHERYLYETGQMNLR